MADQHSTDGTTGQPQGHDRGSFSINARYLIDQSSSLEALMNDVGCLFGAGLNALEAEAEAEAFREGAGWSALYTLRQAYAVFRELERRLPPSAYKSIAQGASAN